MKTFIAIVKGGRLDFGSDYNNRLYQDYKNKHEGKKLRVNFSEVSDRSLRTLSQNNALHKWYELIAEGLNEAGYSVQLVLKEKMDIDWDMELVKELLWRPAQKVILRKKSTTELRKIEDIEKVFNHLSRHLGEKFGIFVDFPNNPNKNKAELL